jgi:WD40 repeat protein
MSTQIVHLAKKDQLTGHNASIYAVISGAAPHTILSGAGDGWVVQWDLRQPDMGRLLAKVETQIFSLCLLAGGSRVVVGNMNGGVHWVDLEAPEEARNIAHHQKGVFGLQQVGEDLFSIGGGGVLTRWSVSEARSLESLKLSHAPLRALAYSARRKELAVGSSDNNIYLIDLESLALKTTISGAHDNSVFCLRYHPQRDLLLSGGRDAHLKIWDLEQEGDNVFSEAAHWFTINDIVFDPEGKLFATGSRDKNIRIWDAQDFKLLKSIETVRDQGHINSVNRLLWTKQHGLVSASDDRRLIIWDIQT